MSDVMIPPWVRPESPETLRIIDDATLAFTPAFGRGTTQRGIWADPRWGLRRRYRGLRSDEKAAILTAMNETRGQLNILRVTPHAPIRGSFATSELFSNNTFPSGTTGWTAGTDYSISVSDRVMRCRRDAMTAATNLLTQTVSGLTLYAPYILRSMTVQGRGSFGSVGPEANASEMLSVGAFGYRAAAYHPRSTSIAFGLADTSASGMVAGDYFRLPYISLSRGALVDNYPNLLQQSDVIGTSPWVLSAATITGNFAVAPDGTTTAEGLVDNASNTQHYVYQPVAVSSAAFDYAFVVHLKANIKTWAFIEITDLSAHAQGIYINLSTGALGTITTTGTQMQNARATVEDCGNGWFRVSLVVRKTGSQTTINAAISAAVADNNRTYVGASVNAIIIWRAGFAQSSVAFYPGQTTSAITAGATQSGAGLYTKGWPASTSNLLLTDDWFEINGELKQLTAPVNSDAGGLAYMQFRPGLAGAPMDGDPIIVFEPFGRFIYPPGAREIENQFGIYADCTMDLEEVYV